jgi:hypothetical protein
VEGFTAWLFQLVTVWQDDYWLEVADGHAVFVVKGAPVSRLRLGPAERQFLEGEMDEPSAERETMDLQMIKLAGNQVGPCPHCGERAITSIDHVMVHPVTQQVVTVGVTCVCGKLTERPLELQRDG